MRSKNYKGTGLNEFTFDDSTSHENVYLHAERNHELIIKNERREAIGGNRVLAVDKGTMKSSTTKTSVKSKRTNG